MKQQQFANIPTISKLRRLQAATVGCLALVFTLIVNSITEIRKERRQILIALRSKPALIAARLYTIEGAPFARYSTDNHFISFPNLVSAAGHQLQQNCKMLLSLHYRQRLAALISAPFLQQALHNKMNALLESKTTPITPESGSSSSQIAGTVSFDPAALNTLRKMGGDAWVSDVLQLFCSNSAQQIEKLQEAFIEQDCDAVRHAAHRLKSAAASIGGLYLAELARNIEHAACDGSLTFDKQLVENLKTEFQEILQIISQQGLS